MFARVFNHLDRFTDDLALIDGGTCYSYGDVLAFGRNVADAIATRTVVIVVCSNRFEAVAGYVGLIRGGHIPLLVHHTIKPAQLRGIAEAFGNPWVFAPVDTHGLEDGHTFGNFELHAPPPGNVQPVLHDDLALLLTTSGTTGSSKFVRLSHTNVGSNTTSIVDYLNIGRDDRAITTMPMSYTYGLSILNTHLSVGASVVLTEETILQKPFWELLNAHEVTTFGGVPFIYEMLKKLRFADMYLPSLRYITQAGGRLAPDLARSIAVDCKDKGINFIVMYGQTEATARISFVPAADALKKAGSIGIAIPGGRMWLAADGELMYQGANVCMGYAEGVECLARGDDNGGILATGDLAQFDTDGYATITGRKKRILKVYGHRINLEEVEDTIRAMGVDCACAGIDDELRIFVAGGADTTEVRNLATALTSINGRGLKVIEIDSIPRTTAGKVAYPVLQDLAG